MTIPSYYYSKKAARPSQSPAVTALPKGEPRVCAPLYKRIPRRREAVRPYNRLPYLRLILALSFRASDRRHWRGNPFPAPAGAEHPRGGLSKGTFRAPARGTFALGGKSTQKRRSNLRFENPCAPSPVAYLARFSHANAVPCKFHLNIALSLLLRALPLLLWNAGLCASLVHDKIAFQPAALGRHLPLPLRGKGAI